jgi:geranylgeranyl reductase family protein
MFDVIVVGGGPVGSYTAGELATRGYRVIICERKYRVGDDVCCTGIIGREAFSSLPLNQIAGRTVVREARAARLFSPSGRLLRLSKEEPQAFIVHRPAFDAELARWAQEQGVEYLLGADVRGVGYEDSLVRVEIEGRAIPLEAKTVVLACGFGSPLPQRLGMGTIDDFVVGAQCEVEVVGQEEVEVYFSQKLAAGFFAWLVPTFEDCALAGLMSRHNPDENLRAFLANLQAKGKVTNGWGKMNFGAIPLRPLPKTAAPRVLVVGEVAGQVKPTTGGGIYYGLLGAQVLVEVLVQALECDDFSGTRLRQYESEWRSRLGRELRIGYLARRVYEKLSDKQIEWLFGCMGRDGVVDSLLAAEGFSFDWHGRLILNALKHESLRALWRSVRAMR